MIAEKILGLKVEERGLRCERGDDGQFYDIPRLVALRPSDTPNTWGGQRWENLRPYSTDIAAAWEVVEHLRRNGRFVQIDLFGYDGEDWRVCVSVDEPEKYEAAEAETAPLAICLAALRAFGGASSEATNG
jgi:hypothetical protein